MITRRSLIAASAAAVAVNAAPRVFAAVTDAQHELVESELIYLTPLRSNGSESRCHGEVWFQFDGTDIWVVTANDAWRAEAIRRGLARTRAWVGEFGVWSDAGERYRGAPSFEANGHLETAAKTHEQALDKMGGKYTLEWLLWGPRFRKGLAEGSRVLLRYSPIG